MASAKHLPLVILGLMLGSGLGVLVLGARFAREEKVVTVERDQAPLTGFTAKLLGEIGELETLYEERMLAVRERVDVASSTLEISSICRNIVGLDQVTIFKNGDRPVHLDLRQGDRSEPLPLPRAFGDDSSSADAGRDGGVLIDVESMRTDILSPDHQWIAPPGQPPHFTAKLGNAGVLVLRVNPAPVAAEMDTWLENWLPSAFAPVEVSGLTAELRSPAGRVLAMTALTTDPGRDSPPALLLPVSSRFGEWKVASWAQMNTLVTYRQPVLVGSAALAVFLAVAGIFAFVQQRRALRLAAQRVSFANRVSHELRTPLTNILLNIDLVEEAVPEDSGAGKRLELIRDEAGRLSRLLENVLTFSRRDADVQSPRLTSCKVNEAIDDVLEQFAPALRRRNIAVTRPHPTEGEVFALADPDALRQILGNLVSNVEKYGATSGKMEIGVDLRASNDTESVILSVTDHGSGIPASKAERIFQPFVRLNESTSEGVSGTGLGLSIARGLAESMDGTLVLAATIGKKGEGGGARFELALPRATPNIIAMAS